MGESSPDTGPFWAPSDDSAAPRTSSTRQEARRPDSDDRLRARAPRDTAAPRLSIVIPTKNEEGNIARLVEELDGIARDESIEIIFVDDSTDGTPAAVRAAATRARRRVTLIHRRSEERQGGLSGAVVSGIRRARGSWICVMDADMQHPPLLIEALLAAIGRDELDLVVASRYRRNDRVEAFGFLRSALSKVSTRAAKLIFRGALNQVTDPMSGFFLVRRDALDLDALEPRGFKILLEILVRTPNLRVAEVPFTFGERFAGESKASTVEGARYLAQLLELRFGPRLGHFVRFSSVGASGIVVNTLAFGLFSGLIGLHYLVAALWATQVSTLWNFVLIERWAFRSRAARRSLRARVALFFALNNIALALRGPFLVLLVSGLKLNDVLANLITVVGLTVIRFGVSDGWIWGGADAPLKPTVHQYDIHGVVTVQSPVRLPELEPFRVASLARRPTIRVQLGRLSRSESDLASKLTFVTRHTRYDEGLGRMGFGVEIAVGKSTEIVASPMLRFSPHVLYTNVVEPVLRWKFVERGYALAHAACITFGDDAYLITARTDTGKTTTVLKTLQTQGCAFLSDDLTLVRPDGRVLCYPKPLTISRHTVAAIQAPLRWAERLPLLVQSRVHSRTGRRFALLLARSHLPVATINAIVQLIIPPPKYDVGRLVPGVRRASEAKVARLIVISREGVGSSALSPDDAVTTLIHNTDDAYGFPPYPFIEQFLHSGNGHDLRTDERRIIGRALDGVPAIMLRSSTMDWANDVANLANGHALNHEPAPLEAGPIASIPVPITP